MRTKNASLRAAIGALLIVSVPGMATAQQRPEGRGRDLDQTMLELTEQLELSEQQAGQIRVPSRSSPIRSRMAPNAERP